MPLKVPGLLFLLLFASFPDIAQSIRGEVLDMDTKRPLDGVSIENIYTALNITTDSKGAFLIAATSGQLLVFKKSGYKTTRVRIPQGYIPPYFRIIISKGVTEIKDKAIAGDRYDYRSDSIRFHDLYQHELDFPKMSTFDMIAHPFSAMSGRNRAIWQFQDDYSEMEREKYVDMTFNEAVVTKFTGLTGDSLHYYMRKYRPSYEQLHSMNDYTFYNYIKNTVNRYRKPDNARSAQ